MHHHTQDPSKSLANPVTPAPDNPDPATPAPACCALCGTPARYFPLQASLLLDWVLTLQGDVASLQDEITSMDDHLRGLKKVIEQGVLP